MCFSALTQTFYFSNCTMTQARDVIVITSCTNRKRKASTVLALEGTDHADSLSALAARWKQLVRNVPERDLVAAADLYGGRSISEARRAAERLAAPLYIASAGHGLLHAEDGIPSYDITTSPSPENALHRCLLRLQQAPADWWQALVETFGPQRSLAALVAGSPNAVILLAVPSAYLGLLAGELAQLDDEAVARLRILTSAHGASGLAARLQAVALPYDERLEGFKAYAGTRSDFPQRALHHFVAVLNGHALSLEQARERVSAAMDALQKPSLPARQRKTDAEIMALLRQNWERLNGSATALLRYLRDEALVSCEQSRFSALRQQILLERNNRTGTHG
jgi:hypothetical protein